MYTVEFCTKSLYDAKARNQTFAHLPHFEADPTSLNTIFCHGNAYADPRYGFCPYQPAGAQYRALDIEASYAIKSGTANLFFWLGPCFGYPTN